MTITPSNYRLAVSTPLGRGVLLLRGFHGEEVLSGLFHFDLELVSKDENLDINKIIGQHITVTLTLADGSPRYLDGIVTRFYQGATEGSLTNYYAELRPWLWLLTLTTDSRIFQGQSVPEIIAAVFQDAGFTAYRADLSKTYSPRAYCVQYQETAFAFVSRLLEDEGIFYFFEHSNGEHTLVLADDPAAHPSCPGLSAPVRCVSAPTLPTRYDALTACTFERQVTASAYVVDDFNFETPDLDLVTSVSAPDGQYSLYEYPAGHDTLAAGEEKARLRLSSHQWPGTLLRGESFCRPFSAGCRFDLSGHDRKETNQTYVLARVTHQATQTAYSNRFDAFPAKVSFRPTPMTPKPVVAGVQTAIVVGPSGEEIHTDEYGRVKVQFHWDRAGVHDENSSCWIRVSQGWAGQGWGNFFLPRVGQEVVVSFLDGDPDRPLITGAVYNALQAVPYPLPDQRTKSTLKSNSSPGGGGFNELRFEDKSGAEEVFLHAQKDLTVRVLNDERRTIGGDRTVQITNGDETHAVGGRRHLTVASDETHANQAGFTQRVAGDFRLKVAGDLTIDVDGDVTIVGDRLWAKARRWTRRLWRRSR